MARDRLIGDYGKLATGTLGVEETTTFADGTYYIISGVDASSALNGTPEVGYLYRGGGETLVGDDAGYPLTFTDKCDLQNWSLEFAKGEVDVTTLCDDQKVYKASKTDVTGSLEGVNTIGVTDADGGFQNNFIDIVKQSSSTYVINKIDDGLIYAFLYTQESTASGETESLYVAPIEITGFSQGASVGDEAQTFSTPFRLTTDSVNGVKPHYFQYEYA